MLYIQRPTDHIKPNSSVQQVFAISEVELIHREAVQEWRYDLLNVTGEGYSHRHGSGIP